MPDEPKAMRVEIGEAYNPNIAEIEGIDSDGDICIDGPALTNGPIYFDARQVYESLKNYFED